MNTIEDGFQYRMHKILRKFAKDHECEKEFEADAELAAWEYKTALVEYILNDISEYCGTQEAYENDH